MATLEELSEAIQKGNAPKAKELTTALLAAKMKAGDVLNKGLLDGMEKIGKRFQYALIRVMNVLNSSSILFYLDQFPKIGFASIPELVNYHNDLFPPLFGTTKQIH